MLIVAVKRNWDLKDRKGNFIFFAFILLAGKISIRKKERKKESCVSHSRLH